MECKTCKEIYEKTGYSDAVCGDCVGFCLMDRNKLKDMEETHDYCNHCGITFEKRKDDYCCPICINLNEDEDNSEEAELIYLTTQRNKLNREISEYKLKKVIPQ